MGQQDLPCGETVHVAFGRSRAESIADALVLDGRAGRVIGLPGALDMGPIDPPDPDRRFDWFRTVLRADPAWHGRESEAEWMEATSALVHPVFWVCRAHAGERAALGEFAFRMAGRPFDIVDATELDAPMPDGARRLRTLGQMRAADIVAAGLPGRRRPLGRAERDALGAEWERLRAENAPFRVVRAGRLVSAPLDVFDAVLLAAARPEGEVAAGLVGRAMQLLADERGDAVDGVALFGRILALGEAGSLDVAGPGPRMRDRTVRRAGGC